MGWRWVLLVTILAITGCQGSGSKGTATDPFFGRTRVEPPRNGVSSRSVEAAGE